MSANMRACYTFASQVSKMSKKKSSNYASSVPLTQQLCEHT